MRFRRARWTTKRNVSGGRLPPNHLRCFASQRRTSAQGGGAQNVPATRFASTPSGALVKRPEWKAHLRSGPEDEEKKRRRQARGDGDGDGGARKRTASEKRVPHEDGATTSAQTATTTAVPTSAASATSGGLDGLGSKWSASRQAALGRCTLGAGNSLLVAKGDCCPWQFCWRSGGVAPEEALDALCSCRVRLGAVG
ncbi:unnamed protein product [Chrysodeixis includens]|uniref:Uncharacterized protein n=1 Tax=Chrysodeixis includens TaxID=689277 RepID=A0A9P0DWY3_CHRIL|nr:unnamed protein product [Chrysodeixis includens]